jgi:hypothetical protein
VVAIHCALEVRTETRLSCRLMSWIQWNLLLSPPGTCPSDSRRMETSLPLQQTRRLGFREPTAPRQEANQGSGDFTEAHSSCCAARWDSEAVRMAHVPAPLLDSPPKCRNRIQSDARTAATFLVAFNVGCLHAGDLAGQARCTSSRTRSRLRVGNELRCSSVSGQVMNRSDM